MKTVRVRVMLSALALVIGVGCGSTVNDDDPAASGSGASGSGGAGSGASGSGASGGSTSSGSGGAGGCAAFADQEGVGTATVRFRNDSPLPVYLPANCTQINYTIRPTAGSDSISYVYGGGCVQTCEDRQTSTPIDCGACPEIAFVVPVGGTLDVQWNGTGLRTAEMPAECYEGPADSSCSQIVAAQPNEYRVEVTGFGACEGECTCDATGQCFGTASGPQAWADVTDFDFPTNQLVEVVFGPCAFGCAEN
jgi:hypothetical protein